MKPYVKIDSSSADRKALNSKMHVEVKFKINKK